MVELGGPSAAQDVVGDRYRLLEVIGAGGMGTVWRAEDEVLGRTVAVKEITTPANVSTSEMLDLRQSTMREARAAARLDHPGVVQVFDVIWRPGRSWIVMEYVPSRSLHDTVREDGPMSHQDAARIGLGVLAALRAAHSAGVLHRDVKPHNVLLADDGRVVLADFGLATLKDADPGESGPLLGSPFYLAPERLTGLRTAEPSDLWSLGATLYEAVEGRPPFRRSSTTQSLCALMTEPPDPPARPGPLHAVLSGLLVKDPAQRLTADQMEPQLRAITDRAVGISAVPRPREVPRRRRAPVISPVLARSARFAAATAAVLLIGTSGAALVFGRETGPAAAMAATMATGPSPAAGTATTCDFENGARVTGSPTAGSYALPEGWLWHTDATGYQMAVPQGWTQVTDGNVSCFRDPDGSRSLTVDTGARLTGSPLAHWQQAETAALANGSLPGYRRIALANRPGGAEWEYSWQPAAGPRQHEQRVLLTAASGRTYLAGWSTAEADWSAGLAGLQLILASLA